MTVHIRHGIFAVVAICGLYANACGRTADPMLPEHYALVATSRVADAEKDFRRTQGRFGAIGELLALGLLEASTFKKYQSGAHEYSFELQYHDASYRFSATPKNPLLRPTYSADESGQVTTLGPGTGGASK